MSLLYGAALLVSLGGLTVIDRRFRLVLFTGRDGARRGAATVAVGVGFFVLWDLVGIGLGVFFRGTTRYLSGVLVAPELPVEELGFLTLLSYLTLLAYVAAARWWLGRSASHRAGGAR
ncbi:lycopene cyclase domain-containing protein [Actinotalea sp.]|uniref:lycopene cyclase domain-containing protein n=1 Tax=Actinotalea sp. TaxID=1872145 RepID=UPI003563CF39